MNSDVVSPARPARPGGPASGPDGRRSARPVRPPRPGSPAQPPKSPVRPAGRAGQAGPARRTSFVLLLLGLLGGGLVCLLVVNTTLAANSIQIINLQKTNALRREQVQELEQQVAVARSAATIAKEARRLGLRPEPELIFIDLRTRRIEAPRGAAAAALAARLAEGLPASAPKATGPRSGVRRAGKKRAAVQARGSGG